MLPLRWTPNMVHTAPAAPAGAARVCGSGSGTHHAVRVVHGDDQLLEEPAGQLLGQAPALPHKVRQVTPRRKLH